MLRKISEQSARLSIEDLVDRSIDRISHQPLLWLASQHRDNVSAYDAFYVAAARISNAPLLTADGPLSRAAKLGISIENVRLHLSSKVKSFTFTFDLSQQVIEFVVSAMPVRSKIILLS